MCISENVIIGNDCVIADMVTICANVEIGDNTFIESGVVFAEKLNQRAKDDITPPKTHVGNNVSIHSRAVIEAGSTIEDNTLIDYGEIISLQK